MATFVLVHGGGHGGWCWQPVARRLRAKGHEVHAPSLTGLGDRRHLLSIDIDLLTHVEDVVSLLFHEDLSDVILVGHSYGGMVITGVADALAQRIKRLVYLDAAIPRAGESLLDTSPGLEQFNDVRIVDGVPLGLWPENVIGPVYGLHGALAQWALPRLSPHPWRTFETQLVLQNEAGLQKIPRAIINCAGSLARRTAETRSRWLDGDFVREVDYGHDLMLTEPAAVSRLLLEIADLGT
ncbi:MAG: alpha/beta hydrolase [Novosphingobium sp.]|nr:alpha/beta hydrolase [Novosphingobium sp.]